MGVIVGLIALIGGLFAHPETCLKGQDILQVLTPHGTTDWVSHISVIAGTIILAGSKSFLDHFSSSSSSAR